MALCPTAPNPSAVYVQNLGILLEQEPTYGDYVVVVAGTRNTGTGTFYLRSIPRGATVSNAWLLVNTYQSNNQPDPIIGFGKNTPSTPLTDTPFGLCNSTCWQNLGPENTTYLRNRVYAFDVGPAGDNIVNGNGTYAINGIPVDLGQPIGFDGCRLPGCQSSQGAALFVAYEYANNNAPAKAKVRQVNLYSGAVLIDNNPGIWGGANQFGFNFTTFYNAGTPVGFYNSNGHCTWVTGDVHPSLGGTNVTINNIPWRPPNNAWPKYGTTISWKDVKGIKLLPSNGNQTYLRTSNNCISWFLFANSGDLTTTPDPYTIIQCLTTYTSSDIPNGNVDDEITFTVYNTIVDQPIVDKCGGKLGLQWPAPPFYCKIDNELFKVTAIEYTNVNLNATVFTSDWTATRLISTQAEHPTGSCITAVMTWQGKKVLFNNYAPQGQPPQRPQAGAAQGNGL